ncbi:MAG: hypothetical protein JSW61_14750 [Candidatus Thorarchaeota archaeon]|nr:MAG: hypothetical protein JSW61_14750 [Candidatus Thorarchaeota archaeon]
MSTDRVKEIVDRLSGQDEPLEDEAASAQTTAPSDGQVTDDQTTEYINTQKEPPDATN